MLNTQQDLPVSPMTYSESQRRVDVAMSILHMVSHNSSLGATDSFSAESPVPEELAQEAVAVLLAFLRAR